jgi:hypothetical protein
VSKTPAAVNVGITSASAVITALAVASPAACVPVTVYVSVPPFTVSVPFAPSLHYSSEDALSKPALIVMRSALNTAAIPNVSVYSALSRPESAEFGA